MCLLLNVTLKVIMNHIFSYTASLSHSLSSIFTQRLLPELTAKQKKILIISSIAMSILTACFLVYRYCFRQNPRVPNHPNVHPYIAPKPRVYIPPSPRVSPVKNFYGRSQLNLTPNQSPQGFSFKQPPIIDPPKSSIIQVDTSQISPRTLAAISKAMFPSSPKVLSSPSDLGAGGNAGVVKDPVVNPLHQTNGVIKQPRRVLRTDLEGMEDDINDFMEDLKTERQVLDLFSPLSPLKQSQQNQKDVVKKDDAKTDVKEDEQDLKDEDVFDLADDANMTNPTDDPSLTDPVDKRSIQSDETKQRVVQLEKDLETALKAYPATFRQYLEDKFTGYQHKDLQDIYYHLVKFSDYMDTQADNEVFIHDCLKEMDAFLTRAFFTSRTEMCLQEEKKTDLIVFHKFFDIVEKHFKVLEKTNPQLALNLKVKLANLPLRDEVNRSKGFPNVYLKEQDQLRILIDHFEKEEEKHITLVTQNLHKKFTENDIHKLSKIVSKKQTHLRIDHRQRLQDALIKQMGHKAPANWDDSAEIENDLKKFFKPVSSNNNPGYHYNYGMQIDDQDILSLHRANKAKEYFASQLNLDEDQIQIPRWYHATSYQNLKPIIDSGKILVLHRQAYNGAWVSTQREISMGECVFVFNHRITEIDPNVFIGYEKGQVRWRGLQKEIPLAGSNKTTNMHLVGYNKDLNTKTNKTQIITNLSKSFKNVKVVSVDQIDYLQREIIKVIGNPNLSEKWWGKADISALEKPLNQHQHM